VSGPQLNWANVVTTAAVLCVMAGGGYKIIEVQFDELNKQIELNRSRLTILEAEQKQLIAHAAHNPVEAKEVDQLSGSVDKRIELLQQQINDINRQIAASVLQNGYPSHPQLLPK
jgi:hypothetical protein